MASTTLIHHTPGAVSGCPDHFASPPRPDHSGPLSPSSPQSAVPPPHGMVASWLNLMELLCSEQVTEVLLSSKEPSTRATYLAKWKRFTCWCDQRCTPPVQSPVSLILEYLLHLKQQGLAASSKRYISLLSRLSTQEHLDALSLPTLWLVGSSRVWNSYIPRSDSLSPCGTLTWSSPS